MKKLSICIIAVLIFASFSFYALPFLPSVGGKPSKTDRQNYSERASNFDGKIFHNEKEVEFLKKTEDYDSARLSTKPAYPENSSELPVKKTAFLKEPSITDFTFTWLGHSTLFIQMHGKNILIDPVFSERISPVNWAGPKKFTTPSINIEEFPQIDLLILSHDHYDHLDYKCIKKIDSKVKQYIVPLGVECHLKKWKVKAEKITNIAWWEQAFSNSIEGLEITAIPAQHFSGRWITGRNRTLWCGYVIKDEYRKIIYTGDTGYGEHFKKIHEKFGDFDLAIMECGQYNSRWPMIHSFPEESVQAALDLGAKIAVPVHWGAIVLSTNGWNDSVLRFVKTAEEKELNYITPYICQTVTLDSSQKYRDRWYE